MKKGIVLAVLLILGISTSQAQLLKFGVKGGLNFANYTGGDVDGFDFKSITSYHAGVVAEIKIFENFALQPELLYSSQGAKVNSEAVDDINFNYVTVPVLAKFYLISDRLSVEAGPQFSFLIDDNVGDQFESESFDFAAVGGIGLNITDNIFAQARYVVGLTEASKDAEVKNRVIQVSLGYRF